MAAARRRCRRRACAGGRVVIFTRIVQALIAAQEAPSRIQGWRRASDGRRRCSDSQTRHAWLENGGCETTA